MMKVRIPYELKLKFLNMEGLESEIETYDVRLNGIKHKLTGDVKYKVILDLKNDSECLEACIKWKYVIKTYFKTSYKAFRIDIGPYKGLWPIIIYSNGTVEFILDEVYLDRKDWKDWFIKEDVVYAPKINS